MSLALGIDPGTAATGFGLIERDRDGLQLMDYGVIRTSPKRTPPQRLLEIHARVGELIERHRPTEVVVEKIFLGRNASSAMAVGQARGVVLLAAGQAGVAVYEYNPQQVKQAVAGYGQATKEQIQEVLRDSLDLPEPPRPHHAADAIAVALCHFHTSRLSFPA
ncbi:MAG: crossover junction endodeoxyribonuclease RuvC [Anaerolineae bacterium]